MLALGVYLCPLVGSRRFPISPNPADNAHLSYPYRGWIIGPLGAVLASIGPTVVVALLFSLRLRSLWDFTSAIMGTAYAVIIAECAHVFLKIFITGFRPYFLTVCDPDPAIVSAGGEGLGELYFSTEVCRQTDSALLKQAMTSFPSGHAACGFSGLGFLFLYLSGKLKPWGNYRPMSWEIPVVVAPLVGAMLLSCTVLVHADHHASDVVVGACMGVVSALVMYRAMFASLWDWRFNHIPLRPWEVVEYEVAGENMEGVVLHKGFWETRVGRNFEGERMGYWQERKGRGAQEEGVVYGEQVDEGVGGNGPGGSAGSRAGMGWVAGEQMV